MSKEQNTEYVHGIHAVQALLTKYPERILRLFIAGDRQDDRMQKCRQLAKKANITSRDCSKKEMDKMVPEAIHQGIIATCKIQHEKNENDLDTLLTNLTEPALLLVLDCVQDPHNLGACLRTAEAAGAHAVIVPKDRAVGLTGTARKAACGAAEIIPLVQVTNLARCLRNLKEFNIWLRGADERAERTIYQTDLRGSLALVLGAEGQGLRRLTKEHCDELMQIPMQGIISSLNVSVAVGVCLFEALRQRY